MSESDLECYFTSNSEETVTETDTTFSISTKNSLYESDIDEISISSSISCKTEESMLLFDSFEEDEIDDIIEDIYEQFEDCYNNKMIKVSSPKFYNDMIHGISHDLLIEWEHVNICDEDDFQQILDFVESQHEAYLAYNSHIIPRSTSNIVYEKKISQDELTATIEYIQSQPQPAQRTDEWYDFRNSLLSASSLWKALGSQSQINSLIYEKCKAYNEKIERVSYGTANAMHWGVKYEPVTTMIYENMYQTKIGEFGCIRHSTYPFVGASPDGINILPSSVKYGNMLEIKNIVNREITGIPKEEYWIQTQIQMETCNLDNCDFVETRIKEYADKEDFYNNSTNSEYRGVILYFIKRDLIENDSPVYHYMPLDIPLTQEAITEWINKDTEEIRNDGLVLFETLYWYLDEISCVLIQRNKPWFSNAIHKIQEVWDTIQVEKIKGYEHRSPKRRIPKTSVSVDTHSGTNTLSNVRPSNKVCLIKLDS